MRYTFSFLSENIPKKEQMKLEKFVESCGQ